MQVQVRKEERHKDQDIEAKWDYFQWKKQALNHFANNYYRLKMEIGYESGHSSESVSSRNDEDYDHSDGNNHSESSSKDEECYQVISCLY